MATCLPCNEANLPQCGDPLRLICLQNANDTAPIAAWFEPVCVEGEVVSFDYFSDEAGTVPLVGYTMADRVNCPSNMRGINCDVPINTDLCPSSLNPILAGLEEIEAAVDELDTNYSYVFSYLGNGDVSSVTRTFNGVTENRIFTYENDQLVGVSAWTTNFN